MPVDGIHYGREERQELQVLGRGLARGQQIDSGIGTDGPVAMLARAVHPVERLLMEDDLEVMLLRHFLHQDHKHHVLVDRRSGITEHRSTFELVGSHFVMPCLELYAQLVRLGLEVFHECTHLQRNRSEIVVFQLLVLCGCVSYDCPVAQYHVGTGIEQGLIHEEILLLDTEIDPDRLHILIEKVRYGSGRIADGLHRLEVRHFRIKRLSGI